MRLDLYLNRLLFTHPERPDKSKNHIGCIGDSITFGAGVPKTRKTDAWPAVWQNLLNGKWQVLNYGVSGATLQDEGDFPYYKVGFLDRLEKDIPKIILLMLGTNDSKPQNWNAERYKEEYETLVQKLVTLPWAHKTVLLVPPKAFPETHTGVVAFDINNDIIRDEIRPAVIETGKRYSLPVIDLYALTESSPDYFCDGVHPNVPGNHAIAKYVFSMVPTDESFTEKSVKSVLWETHM